MIDNTGQVVDIEVIQPGDIELEIGADGTPTTVPGRREGGAAPPVKPAARMPTLAELQEAQRQRDLAAERATRAEAEIRTRAQQTEEMRTLAEAERQRADRASQNEYASQGHAWQTYLQNVSTQKAALQGQITATRALQEAAERELQAASEAGDHRRVAAANSALARAAADQTNLESRIPQVEQAIQEADYYVRQIAAAGPPPASKPIDKPAEPEPQQTTPEQWIDSVRTAVSPDVAEWLSEHKDYVTNPAKHEMLMTFARFYSQKNGGQTALRSAKFLGALKAEFTPDEASNVEEAETVTEDEPPAAAQEPRRAAPPAAPVSRSASPSKPSTDTRIKLTQEQYAIAPSLITSVDDLDPDIKTKFGGVWTETAARMQYHRNMKRAETDQKGRGLMR